MILQNLVFLEKGREKIRELYYHTDSKLEQQEDGSVQISGGTRISFDSYFNLFSGKSWLEYTTVNQCVFQVKLQGKGIVFLKREDGSVVEKKRFYSKESSFTEEVKLILKQIESVCYYLEIYAEEVVNIFSAKVMTNVIGKEVHLALVTCTYNRKEELIKNLEVLKQNNRNFIEKVILDKIYVVDNARTLCSEEIESDNIVLIPL